MDIELGTHDRIVVEYMGTVTKETPRPIQCVVAYEEISGVYVVLWKKPEDSKWQLMWRGNWDSAMKYFAGFIGDLEIETIQQLVAEATDVSTS